MAQEDLKDSVRALGVFEGPRLQTTTEAREQLFEHLIGLRPLLDLRYSVENRGVVPVAKEPSNLLQGVVGVFPA